MQAAKSTMLNSSSYCTGKFTEANLPKGPRGATINKERVAQVQPLLGLMRDIGSGHQGKTPGQVRTALTQMPTLVNSATRPAIFFPAVTDNKFRRLWLAS